MEEMTTTVHTAFAAYDPDVVLYDRWTGGPNNIIQPYEFHGWVPETRAWKESCYISTNLSGSSTDVRVKGPTIEEFMSEVFINSFSLEKFPVGAGKHLIACSEKGTILAHGVGMRTAEDEFVVCGHSMMAIVEAHAKGSAHDVTVFGGEYFKGLIVQLAGPRALEVLENTIKEDIHDLKFMRFRQASVEGLPVRVLRMGMGGTIAYEIHAKAEDAMTVYNAVVEVGKAYGAEKLGHLAYMCNHTENGFPQYGTHFMLAYEDDPELLRYFGLDESQAGEMYKNTPLHGSMSGEGLRAYYANPIELDWGRMINWDNNFKGKAALKAIAADPKTRSICTLEWEPEDILNIFRAYYDKDDMRMPDRMEYPQRYFFADEGNLADKVLDENGNVIGKSSGIVYTAYYKSTISLCVIDPAYNEIGKEVTVLWGTEGTRQIPIRAKVARYPYLDLTGNKNYDLESIPHYKP